MPRITRTTAWNDAFDVIAPILGLDFVNNTENEEKLKALIEKLQKMELPIWSIEMLGEAIQRSYSIGKERERSEIPKIRGQARKFFTMQPLLKLVSEYYIGQMEGGPTFSDIELHASPAEKATAWEHINRAQQDLIFLEMSMDVNLLNAYLDDESQYQLAYTYMEYYYTLEYARIRTADDIPDHVFQRVAKVPDTIRKNLDKIVNQSQRNQF